MPSCPLSENNVIVKVGNPVKQVVSAAQDGKFDMIIMGTHGHGKLAKSMVASIASDVLRQSTVPVLVVRLPKENESGKL